MNFLSVYDIALDILDKVGGDVTKAYDSAYSVALAILDEIGGDATKNFDSVYSIMEEIYRVRFGESISGMDSVYSIAKKINEDLGDQTTGYDSTYSILVDVDENPYLIGHEFSIVTDSANTVIINGEEITSGVFPIGTTITWSVSRTGYVSQSGTYVMGNEDYSIEVTLVLEQHTFTIVPTPGDATVTINGEERSSIIADYGTTITWSVEKEHYASQSGSLVLTADVTESVSLVIDQFTFAITTAAENTVVINGEERTSLTADYGTAISWSVSREHYVTQSNVFTLTADATENITLVLEQHTFTIVPTPGDATVTINGQERSSITADYGTSISWSVEKEHYVSQNGSLTLTADATQNVTLALVQHTFSITTDSANTVVINGETRTSITADYGTTITWSVSREHYVTQTGTFTLTSDNSESITLVLEQHTFNISATPADATVTINGETRTSITADYGTAISWSVSRTGYASQSGSYTLTQDHTESVSLVINQYTFTIVPVPADATVTINGETRTSITADYGTTINWSVAKTGYATQSGTEVLTETYSMEIDLSISNFTFTIEATPIDAVVTINGEQRTSLTAAYGTAITWSVSKSHYVTQSGSYTLTGDHYETVDLVLEQHTFSISTDVANTVVINGVERTSITADYGTTINWSVSREHYVTQSGTFTLTADDSETVTLVLQQFTFTITANPNDAVVTINGSTRSSITADYGTSISWSVAKTHYVTQSNTFTLTADASESVTLVLEQHTFSITTDSANTVMINGAERSSITADYGTSITWSVSREHYVTQGNTFTLTADATESVTLVLQQFTFSITTDPTNTVVINGSERSSITADYGTSITWSVSKSHYVTQSNTFTLTADATESVTLVLEQHTFTISTDSNNTVVINGAERSSITADYGTTITWSVSREHYVTQSNTLTLTADTTESVTLVLEQFTFTINPTPADAVVTINGQTRTSLTADYGTSITWSVSKTHYTTQSNSLTLTADTTQSVTLALEQFTFTINPTPADAVMTINGQVRSSLTADYGTAITWSVAKTNYVTQSGSYTLESDHTENVTLSLEQHTFTISATPNDATVTINGQTRTTITADYGTAITWSVAKTGYVTQTGSYTLTQDHTESVTLVLEQYTFTIVPDPSDAVVIINNETRSAITADYGTVISWEVSKTGYTTQTGSYTLTQDHTENVTLAAAGATITFNKGAAAVKLVVNGEYLGTDAATHTITVDPGTAIHWEAYRAGYQTKKGDFTANSDTSVDASLSTAKFIRGWMNYNGTVSWSIYNTASGAYDPLTINMGTYSDGKKSFYSTETALTGYSYNTTFQRSGSASNCQEIKMENIGSTIAVNSQLMGTLTAYASTPVYLSLDGCRATSIAGAIGSGTSKPQYVYLNNWNLSTSVDLQTTLGGTGNYGYISRSMPASTNASTAKTIADYPNRLKELHMNCWESIPTPAVITNGDSSYTGSIIEVFSVQSGSNQYNGNKTHIMNLMNSAEVDVYAYGWTSANITKLKDTFKLHTYALLSSGYYTYAMSGCGVIRIHISDHEYWQWRMIDEYPSDTSFSWSTTSKKYYNCSQWTLVDTNA